MTKACLVCVLECGFSPGARVRRWGFIVAVAGCCLLAVLGLVLLEVWRRNRMKAQLLALQALADDLEGKVKTQMRELRESEAQLQGFIQHASAAIAFKGLDGRYLLINPRMEKLLGLPAGEILGRTNEDLLPPAVCTELKRRDDAVICDRKDLQVEEQWPQEDGSIRHFLVHKFPLVDATGHCWGMGIISTEITGSKHADQFLFQSQKLESLGVMAGGIAHDFNNLLGAMRGNVELALVEPSLAQARPHLETLMGIMGKASGLLGQMLAYAGQGKGAVRILDLNQVVEEMTRLLETSITKKAQLRLELHPGPLPMAGDLSQVQQVVMNLVINASEALGDHAGVITILTRREDLTDSVILTLYRGQTLHPGPHVSLEVSDNGAGMAPEVLERIFEPFFTTKFTGRGLGLAAIHGIIRAHQAGIRVHSEPGQGSTFRLLFRASGEPVQPPAPEPEFSSKAASGAGGLGTILVVDDEAAMRSVVVKTLVRAGYSTLQAQDGMDALHVYLHHRDRIRLILLDLTMPNMDGEETCRELRRRGMEVPIILCSGFSELDAIGRFEGLGLAGFLQKPFGLGLLMEMVRKTLGNPP